MRARIILFILLILSLVACKPPTDKSQVSSSSTAQADGLKARVEFDQNAKLGPAVITVYVLDNNKAVSGASVEVTGDMTHAGMVPVISEALETETGLYKTKDFEFTMAGDWILTTVIKTDDGKKLTVEDRLTVKGK